MPNIGIIGGGVAGCATALTLAEKGHNVTLFEGGSALLAESSDATSHCFGIGFYYLDEQAARFSLENVIRLIRYLRQHPSAQATEDLVLSTSTVTYVISKHSQTLTEEVIARFEQLKKHYAELVQHDPQNEVLGLVEKFFRVCDLDEFSDVLNLDDVAMIIETCDSLFDWDRLKQQFIDSIAHSPRIRVHLNHSVESIEYGIIEHQTIKTRLRLTDGTSPLFDDVINAAWRNVDRLNQSAGFPPDLIVDNQWMLITMLALPKTLHNRSFFVGHPNHLFLTSGPNGIGYLTYTPVSFMGKTNPLREQSLDDAFMADLQLQKNSLAQTMLQGAANFIVGIETAEILDVKVGVIRASIPNDRSYHRAHEYRGIRKLALGFMSNEARQHTFWLENARHVATLVEEQQPLKARFAEAIQELIQQNATLFFQKPELLSAVVRHFSALWSEGSLRPINLDALNENFASENSGHISNCWPNLSL